MKTTEIRIRSLLNMLQERLHEQDSKEIIEYLDHNEWGVAYESLISIIICNKIHIDKEIYIELIDLGRTMELEINEDELKQLDQLCK